MRALLALIAIAGCGRGPGSGVTPGLDGGADATADAGPDAAPDAAADAAPDAAPDGPPPLSSCTGQTDGVTLITSSPYTGTNMSATHDATLGCGHSSSFARDVELQLDLPDLLTFRAVLTPEFPAVASIHVGRCNNGPSGWGGCDINATVPIARWQLNNSPAGRYYVLAYADSTDPSDSFTLTVSGEIQPNGRCDLPLATSGALVCASGTTCNGARCVSASGECGDGADNDGDGKNGYPADPGCASITDPTELDDCPMGPGCAPCATAADEDGDGKAGFPTDPGCTSPGDLDESDGCQEPFPIDCPECSNGYDDDLDNEVDLADSACSSAAWNDESPES